MAYTYKAIDTSDADLLRSHEVLSMSYSLIVPTIYCMIGLGWIAIMFVNSLDSMLTITITLKLPQCYIDKL